MSTLVRGVGSATQLRVGIEDLIWRVDSSYFGTKETIANEVR
jgi:hypothetical protein